MKKLLLSLAIMCFSTGLFAQVTWAGASTGGDWQVGTNWSSGAAPTASDAVLLNTGLTDSLILTNLPAAISIAQLTITNTKVRIVNNGTAATTFAITGAAGVDFTVGATSALIFGGTAATAANGVIAMNLASGATAEISGYVQHTSNVGASFAHRLQVLGGASAIAFKSGSTFACGPRSSGNPFGAGASPSSNSSVSFEDGATFIQNGGSNPFASTAPNSVVIFSTNSNFVVNTPNTISASGRIYGNLEFPLSTYTASSTAASTFTINGNLIVNAGSPVFTASGAGGMVVKGNITVATGASLTFGSATACPVNLTGTTEQTITANGTITFSTLAATTQLILNNAAGAKLGANLKVTKLTLTSGKFKLGNYNLTATTASVPVLSASPTKFIVTDGTGKLRIAGNNTTCVFPVGASATDGDVNQVKLVPATADTFEVRVSPANPGFNTDYGINRTFDISRAGSANLSELYLGYNTAQAGPLCTPSAPMDLGHFDAVNGWEATASNITPDNVATAMNDNQLSVIATISSFSPFSVGTTGQVALGVELTKFDAQAAENQVKLTWQTAGERDNAFFAVEYSRDGRNFETIGEVKGNGTTSSVSNYNFTHAAALQGVNYYRLRQVDFNGKATTTAVRSALVGKNGVRVYPTAANQTLTVEATNETEQTFEILNLQGQKVMAGEFVGRKTLDISELTTGNYFVKIGQTTVRFTKN